MASRREQGQDPGEAIEDEQQEMRGNDCSYQPGQEFLGQHRVLFDELREVIEAGC